MQQQTRRVVYGGLMAVLILVATAYIRIPTSLGYIHMGDGVIFVAAAILGGPVAGLAAGVGSMLADLLAGYPMYAVVTFVIKGLMGLLAGLYLRKSRQVWSAALCLLLLEGLMVVGYLLFESALYGFVAALGAMWFNLVQGLGGTVVGTAGIQFIGKLRKG
ncbi:ECF transporter S component [Eubacteriales bacterium OttesenSCG-928-M02]|nr:ECF transporter S component [Eubacteriales bacterium OttesenSCG-928-M02]